MSYALSVPRLRRILAAYSVNRLGTWFGVVALMVAVYDHTHSAAAVAALLLAAQALPAFVIPAVIARVEASRRRGELSGLYFFEAAATAALAVLLWHFWLPAVLLFAALDGVAASAASALLRAETARAVHDHVGAQLEPGADAATRERAIEHGERQANAALNFALSSTFVAGPALAGVTTAAAGPSAALFIDVGSFLLCGTLLLDLRPHVETAASSVRARLRMAWRHLDEAPVLRRLLLAEAVALVFFETAAPIEVTYAKTTLQAGDRGFGLLLAAWGVGGVLGSLVFARSPRRSLAAMLGSGAFAIGLAYLALGIAPSLALACAAALLGGLGNGIELPSLISLVQRISPPHLHAQMMGAVESLNSLCIAAGLPLGGLLVELGSPRLAFLIVGVGTACTACVLVRIASSGSTPARQGLPGRDSSLRPDRTIEEAALEQPPRSL